ncbi:MAG: collagen-like protein [bacterium]|nr:collagen-like protein [bacterium]
MRFVIRMAKIPFIFSVMILFSFNNSKNNCCLPSDCCRTTAASCRLALNSGLSALQVIQIIGALQALQGPDGELVLQGLQGIPGLQGIQGIAGLQGIIGLTGVPGIQGIQGLTGEIGLQGIQGPQGTAGLNGVVSSAQYVQLGSQPATVKIGQPFTFTTAVLTTPGVIASTAIFNPPFTESGTVFQLVNVGRYEVNFQTTYAEDGGIVIYFGSTVLTMLALPYTMIGKTPNGAVSMSVIIEVTTPDSFLSINAAAGNAVALTVPPNSSTTNQSATTVSFKQIQ